MLAPGRTSARVFGSRSSGRSRSKSSRFSPRPRPAPIRVGDCESMENFALCLFHVRRIFFVLVIVADQMQEAMHGKMGDMMSERLVFAARLSRDCFKGKNNVAEMSTKRLAGHVFGRE